MEHSEHGCNATSLPRSTCSAKRDSLIPYDFFFPRALCEPSPFPPRGLEPPRALDEPSFFDDVSFFIFPEVLFLASLVLLRGLVPPPPLGLLLPFFRALDGGGSSSSFPRQVLGEYTSSTMNSSIEADLKRSSMRTMGTVSCTNSRNTSRVIIPC